MPKSVAPTPGPLRSMTGYGVGRVSEGAIAVEVELRSVNGKGLQWKLRLPPDRLAMDAALEARARKRLRRGSVHGQLRVEVEGHGAPSLDRDALRQHLAEWRRAEKDLGLPPAEIHLSQLLALPGSFAIAHESAAQTRRVERTAAAALDQALDTLDNSRAQEGARLGRELLRLLRTLRRHLARTTNLAPMAVRDAQNRLRERVRALLADAVSGATLDLSREIAMLADRSDVQEELARLAIHVDRIEAGLLQGGAVGRELEFLLQECHREITTLGNKSSDPKISEQVVAMKSLAGQLKEQLANVE